MQMPTRCSLRRSLRLRGEAHTAAVGGLFLLTASLGIWLRPVLQGFFARLGEILMSLLDPMTWLTLLDAAPIAL